MMGCVEHHTAHSPRPQSSGKTERVTIGEARRQGRVGGFADRRRQTRPTTGAAADRGRTRPHRRRILERGRLDDPPARARRGAGTGSSLGLWRGDRARHMRPSGTATWCRSPANRSAGIRPAAPGRGSLGTRPRRCHSRCAARSRRQKPRTTTSPGQSSSRCASRRRSSFTAPGETKRLPAMVEQGLIPFDQVLLCWAVPLTAPPRPATSWFFGPDMPRFASWSICAFGQPRPPALAAGRAASRRHARVSFEGRVVLGNSDRAAWNSG